MIFGRKKNSIDSLENASNVDDRSIMAAFARDYLKERKSKRRWGVFFKLLFFVYIGLIGYNFMQSDSKFVVAAHTAVVDLEGVIGPGEVTAQSINYSLQNAFADKSSVGVVLRINSPGGTPVQAAKINTEIQRLKALYPDKPFYVAISDVCASGGYYVAVAADEIYANPSSIVGSIGVLMNGFGFTDAMNKLGIERRLIVAGEHKAILDPFSPAKPEDVAYMQEMLDDVHRLFIKTVQEGRGDRLSDDQKIYSGLFWSGEKALELGLIDAFGSAEYIAREVIKQENIVNYTYRPNFIEQFSKELGVSIVNAFSNKQLQLN